VTREPLRLTPELRRRLWGGDALPERLGVTAPAGDEPVAEAWLAYGGSRVADGPHAGRTLAELIAAAPEQVVGAASRARYGPIMPLLVKYLDAARDLSVQVHPDDACALRRHAGSGHLGKTESWRVLDARAGATVAWGFVRPVAEAEVRAAIDDGSLRALLRSVPVGPGDVVHNPAGTVHAIGAGTLVYELQQASDLTYRIWDHGRLGADGRPRELHLDDALAVADRSGGGRPRVDPRDGPDGWTTRVACPFYALEEAGGEDAPFDATGDTGGALHLLTLASGQAWLEPADGPARRVGANETWALPAALGRYRLHGRGLILRGRVVEPPEEADG
jgi:mannose-6-phosphate isomerase